MKSSCARPCGAERATPPTVSALLRPRAAAAAVVVALLAAATTLQGCDIPHVTGFIVMGNFESSSHHVGEWRSEQSYWEKNGYRDPETGESAFNSCMNKELSIVQVCGGHGHCAPFDIDEVEHPIFFCLCDVAWAGVECTAKRKKQSVAWFLSLTLGPLAFDEMYLGWTIEAMLKLSVTIVGSVVGASKPGIGMAVVVSMWMFDVVRIGMGPVLTTSHRVEEDLPRITFAVLTVLFFCMLGIIAGLASMYYTVIARRRRWDQMTCYASTKNWA
mmetsp:Transcript_103935/g.298689  ORF Transcript_103935/g.298689 Transcript_103935/m.298689 type:complete len:273 (-) Transcript_103935:22-840(-)